MLYTRHVHLIVTTDMHCPALLRPHAVPIVEQRRRPIKGTRRYARVTYPQAAPVTAEVEGAIVCDTTPCYTIVHLICHRTLGVNNVCTQISFLHISARLLSGVYAASTCAAPTGLEAGMTTTCEAAGALDETCAFACDDGYTLSGDATSACTADNGTRASYQGHLPICTGTISLRSTRHRRVGRG